MEKIKTALSDTRCRVALFVTALFAGVAFPSIAGATVADPTGGGTTTLSTDITGWITTYGVPLIVAVMAVGLIVGLFIRYGKKAVKSGA